MDRGGELLVGLLPAAGKGRRVAGLGWRKELYPLGWDEVLLDGIECRRPRVVASYQADGLVDAGVDRIFVVVGESPELMQQLGGSHRGTPVAYLYQRELRGGAFAIDLMRPWLPERHTVLFGFPDTIVEPSEAFSRLLAGHRAEGNDLTLGLFPTDRPSDFGMVELSGAQPVRIVDKPKSSTLRWMYGLACWGSAVTSLQADFLAAAPANREAVPGDLFQAAIERRLRVGSVRFEEGRFLDIGTPPGLNRAVAEFGSQVRKLGS